MEAGDRSNNPAATFKGRGFKAESRDKMVITLPPTHGYEKARQIIPRRDDKDSLHGDRYPSKHVYVTVEREGRSAFEGVLLRLSGSLNQNRDERDEEKYNGFQMTLRSPGSGHVYVWASPDTGGATTMKTWDWDGNGDGRYKYPIESITVEIEDHEPVCPRCDTTMVFGYSEEKHNRVFAADGSYGEWTAGWLCPECFPGRIKEKERLP